MTKHPHPLLTLLHLSDSALPIGSTAHSYGMETLVFDGELTVDQLAAYFRAYLAEAGQLEAAYVHRAYALGDTPAAGSQQNDCADWTPWLALNRELSARKLAREGRVASAMLGRRLLRLTLSLEFDDRLHGALTAAHGEPGDSAGGRSSQEIDLHHAAVFGLIGGVWQLGQEATILAFLQQTLTGLVSACQRLMPLGQSHAHSIIWSLQPMLPVIARNTAVNGEFISTFTPLLESAGMRHPMLPVRLFIS